MLTSEVVDGTDLIDAVLDGEPDADAVGRLRRQVEEAVRQHGGVRLLVEVRRYEDPRALEVQQELRALGREAAVRRYAVVSDSAAFRAAAERMLAFVPAEGRVLGDRDEALGWLRS